MPSRRKDRCIPSRAGPTFLPLARTRTSMPRKKRLIRAAWARLQRTPFFGVGGRCSLRASQPVIPEEEDLPAHLLIGSPIVRNGQGIVRSTVELWLVSISILHLLLYLYLLVYSIYYYYLLTHFQSCCSERAIDCPSIVIPFGIIYRINRQSKTLNIIIWINNIK